MALDARSAGFVSEADQLVIGAADGFAWVLRPPGTPPGMSSGSWLRGRTVEQFRGLVADPAGAVGAFTSLVTDTMGALVNQPSLQSELATLFGLLFPHLPDLSDDAPVSMAAGLLNADRVWEGDPADVPDRTSGTMRSTQGDSIRVGGDFVVPAGRARRLVRRPGRRPGPRHPCRPQPAPVVSRVTRPAATSDQARHLVVGALSLLHFCGRDLPMRIGGG